MLSEGLPELAPDGFAVVIAVRRIGEEMLEVYDGRSAATVGARWFVFGFQGDVEHDAVVVRVVVVAVGLPVSLAQVNLHVALHESLAFDHQQGVAEIGAGGHAGATGVQDLDASADFGTKRTVASGAALPQPSQLLL